MRICVLNHAQWQLGYFLFEGLALLEIFTGESNDGDTISKVKNGCPAVFLLNQFMETRTNVVILDISKQTEQCFIFLTRKVFWSMDQGLDVDPILQALFAGPKGKSRDERTMSS